MNRKNRKKIYILVVLLLVVGIGLATLRSVLKVDGIGKVRNVNFDVHFENAASTPVSSVTPAVAPVANPADKVTSINYTVDLVTVGDIYEFTVDVVNGGNMNAYIKSIDSTIKIDNGEETTILADKSNIPPYIKYDLTYVDGSSITTGFVLKKGKRKTIKVRVEYNMDITEEQLHQSYNKEISFKLGVTYEHKPGIEGAVRTFDYSEKHIFGIDNEDNVVLTTYGVSTESGFSPDEKYVCTDYGASRRSGQSICFSPHDYASITAALRQVFPYCDEDYEKFTCDNRIGEDYYVDADGNETDVEYYCKVVASTESSNGYIFCDSHRKGDRYSYYCGLATNNMLACGSSS